MTITLDEKEFRYLIDLLFLGNWVMNSAREQTDRITEYDAVESKILAKCLNTKFEPLVNNTDHGILPSRAFEEGGILDVITEYESSVFYDILAEELSSRDLENDGLDPENVYELERRITEYLDEFEENGLDNIVLTK